MADGFLGRWSRRKQEVREGKPVQDPAPPMPQAPVPAGVNAPAPLATQPAAAPVPPEPAAPPLPTLQDAQSLSIDSDFKPFASRAVAPEVRNAAMKKLFTDPHFNVMDGLDIYIDDYTQPDPLPAAMLKEMASAQFMGLVEEESEKLPAAAQAVAPAGRNDPKDPAPVEPPLPSAAQPGQDVAQSGVCTAIPSTHGQALAGSTGEPASLAPASHTEHDHAHLRLQPDDAAERPGPGHSTS
ncbi:hypothetical protein RP29_04050 [Acidovorax temperans]|uniref:DUF3306 domain-containing protein n=1 Tax=Acidovorax temperans TaxID=80878 RepID=A0A0D7KF48_9BURK|nr:DUF3306 domain-containing protein [Acidovorax temperans]KJA11838.1 hypothetical protein RP29_04050 [Acidovorax temperans]